jgi:hypothetical protein
MIKIKNSNIMKKQILRIALSLSLSLFLFISCEKENPKEETPKPPVISFNNPEGIYTVKIGKTITIEPTVENDEGAMYSWTSGGKIISTGKSLTHSWDKTGQVFITFKVVTDYGSAEEEIRVDVAALVPPRITLGVPDGGYIIPEGEPLELTPAVANNDAATYVWTVNAEEVSTAQSYTFSSTTTGTFRLMLKTTNEDGKDSLKFDVHVKTLAEMPFSWTFEKTVFQVPLGRTIALLPLNITNAFNATYTWTVDNAEGQQNTNPLYVFNSEGRAQGNYSVAVTMQNPYHQASHTLTVAVCAPEGTYKRALTQTSAVNYNKVYEFLPAPGQFVNENYTANTMAEAIAYAEGRLRQEPTPAYVSLGGFGGYIVLGFDHSIDNDGGYNFQVLGNAFGGSSEPGIVWVMQDENGDGQPNDTWYELKGSEYGKPETIQDYEVTYYRPGASQMAVAWTDNKGGAGVIDYITGHNQDYYYPLWVKTDTYTLRGTCLKSRTAYAGGMWTNDSFDWGYADNASPIDFFYDDEHPDTSVKVNRFKISNAVGRDGQPANLRYIDFIKVQTGVNVKAGILGENSTEVFGAKDYNLIK